MASEAIVAMMNWMVPSIAEAEPAWADWLASEAATMFGFTIPMLARKIKNIAVMLKNVGWNAPIKIMMIPKIAGKNKILSRIFRSKNFFNNRALICEKNMNPMEFIAKTKL